MSGPLAGIRIIEIAGIGPGPFCGMMLADHGAEVIRVDRPGGQALLGDPASDLLNRSRKSVCIDLKRPEGIAAARRLIGSADGLIEGFRPGVMERLGLGPDTLIADNPKLVYGRMTGWGQDGPYAQAAGHDLNYIAIAGALHGLGQDRSRPHFPGNLLGDYGGGSTYLVIGVLAALVERMVSGQGQVVDAAIVDGAAHLNLMGLSLRTLGLAGDERASGLLDGGRPFYDVYQTSDGRHLAVGPLEPQFYAALLDLLDLTDRAPDRDDPANSTALRDLLAATFAARTMAEWSEVFAGTDACVTPILTPDEAACHPHNAARGTFVESGGVMQPAPAPRFSRTQATLGAPPPVLNSGTREALQAWGIDNVEELIEAGAAQQG